MTVKSSISEPRKPALSWLIWDKVLEVTGFVIALLLLPVAGLFRAVSRIWQRTKLARLRYEYEHTQQHLKLASVVPVDFLKQYLKRLHQIREAYYSTPWDSLEEAQQGYRLVLLAQEALLQEAKAVVINFPAHLNSKNSSKQER